ncbi:HAD hydrolase-like protein [Brachybacterium sp. AOP3-A1-3]|uniref:HAD hydrolase-like protein n=1 Tax=Brachybacterium sp. AOP3-A1-3 TaxID=3457699 RepID=UPI0040332FD6
MPTAGAVGVDSVGSPTAPAAGRFADVPVVLLDLDGTIVDSGPGILDALGHAFARCGEPLPPPAVLRTFIGPPLEDSFCGALGLSPERAEQLRIAYSAHYQEHGLLSAAPYPGMPELISALVADGRTVAVATNKPETSANRLLARQGLGGAFALIGGTDRAAGREGKAAVIGSVLERLGVTADRRTADHQPVDHRSPDRRSVVPRTVDGGDVAPAVMIGDRLHDAQGAAEHSLPAVLVDWGYGGEVERAADLPRAGTVEALSAMLRP